MGMTIMPEDELERATMSVSDFLKKPLLVENGTWSDTFPKNTELLGGLTPDYRLIDSYLNSRPLWADKLSGFRLISATAVIRLQVNANPFQSGRVGLRVLPMAERYRSIPTLASGYELARNACLATKFQQPHVELDCRDTTCILKVPYLAPTNYFALKETDAYNRGNMYLTVMAPLRQGAGATTPDVTWAIYLSYEDVKLVANIIPQSGRLTKSVGSKECDMVMGGPVERILDIGVKVTSALSEIPMISAVATQATWVLGAAKGVASYYGWSKPTISGAPQVFTNQPFRYSATVDGASPAYPVGLSSMNSLDIKDTVSYTKEDEMSWAFLRSVPVYTGSIEWRTSSLPETILARLPLGPRTPITYEVAALPNSTGAITRAVNCGGPVYYFHPQFKLYRGSLKVSIKIAKTTLHSGRLMFVYTPRPGVVTTPTLGSSAYSYRHIVDIRDGNEINLRLPFMSEFGYLPIDSSYGTLDIMVLNELRAPETASDTIDLMVWVAGDDDFEYAVPAGANSLLTPVIPESGAIPGSVPISGATTLVDSSIGSSAHKRQGTKQAESCVGETFTSVLSLLKRSSRIFNRRTGIGSVITVRPYLASVASFDSVGNVSPTAGGDYYSYIAPMYCFYRGSFRFTCFNQDPLSSFAATVQPYPSTATSRIIETGGVAQGSHGLLDWTLTSNGPAGTALATGLSDKAAFQLPYYNTTRVSCVPYSTSDSFTGYIDESVPSVGVSISNVSQDFETTSFYRDVGEDFQFSVFLGCPPLINKSLSFVSLDAAPCQAIPSLVRTRSVVESDDLTPSTP